MTSYLSFLCSTGNWGGIQTVNKRKRGTENMGIDQKEELTYLESRNLFITCGCACKVDEFIGRNYQFLVAADMGLAYVRGVYNSLGSF